MSLLDFSFRVPGAYVFLLWCCLLRMSLPFLPTIFPFSCLPVTDYGLLCDSLHQAMETGDILQSGQGHEAARYTGSTRRGKRLKRYLEDISVPEHSGTRRRKHALNRHRCIVVKKSYRAKHSWLLGSSQVYTKVSTLNLGHLREPWDKRKRIDHQRIYLSVPDIS